MDINWADLELFLAVAESGSLSAAARRLRLGQATVSRRIARLEEQTGQTLFMRGVDGAELTEAGRRILPAARQMSESAGELSRQLSQGEPEPAGTVRLAAAPGVAADFVVPFAKELQGLRPRIRIEVLAGVRPVDLARHEADIALRNVPPSHPELTVAATLTLPVRPHAEREYAARLPPRPRLEDVDWITFAPPFDQVPPGPQLAAAIEGFCPAFTSDDFLVQMRAAELGLGALFLAGTRHRYSRASPLVPLRIDLGLTTTTYVVTAKASLRVPRVRLVLDHLLEVMSETEEGVMELGER